MTDDSATKKDKELHPAEIAKLEAEAEAVKADIAKTEAERLKIEDERAHVQAQTKVALLTLETNSIYLRAKQRDEASELALDTHNFRYVLDEGVNQKSVNRCIEQFTTWSRQKPGCGIELVINSPGGDVIAGFALIDYIQSLRQDGHHITTKALGMAASMGGVLLQAGDTRVMGKNSVLLIHEASFGAAGSYGDVKDRVKLVDLMHERILELFTDRSKVTKAFIKSKWNRTDWWIDATGALKYGFIDSIQ